METKKCPFCAEEIKIEAVKCKHCSSIVATQIELKKPYYRPLLSGIFLALYLMSFISMVFHPEKVEGGWGEWVFAVFILLVLVVLNGRTVEKEWSVNFKCINCKTSILVTLQQDHKVCHKCGVSHTIKWQDSNS